LDKNARIECRPLIASVTFIENSPSPVFMTHFTAKIRLFKNQNLRYSHVLQGYIGFCQIVAASLKPQVGVLDNVAESGGSIDSSKIELSPSG
jgi:hypothetical protein